MVPASTFDHEHPVTAVQVDDEPSVLQTEVQPPLSTHPGVPVQREPEAAFAELLQVALAGGVQGVEPLVGLNEQAAVAEPPAAVAHAAAPVAPAAQVVGSGGVHPVPVATQPAVALQVVRLSLFVAVLQVGAVQPPPEYAQ